MSRAILQGHLVCCLLIASLAGGCSSSSPSSAPESSQDSASVQQGLDALPFPGFEAAPPRLASAEAEDELLGRVTYRRSPDAETNGDSLDIAAGPGELQYGIYRFDGFADADVPLRIDVTRSALAPEGYYIGIADYSTAGWHWSNRGGAAAESLTDTLLIPPALKPVSPTGYCYVAIAVWDGAQMTVELVKLTSEIDIEAPVASFTATPPHGNFPLEVDFDASDSFVRGGGGFSNYEWDFDNDGTIDASGPSYFASHTYEEPGEFHPRLRVTANTNGYTDEHAIDVFVHGWIHTLGDSEIQCVMDMWRRENQLYVLGAQGAFGPESDYLLASFDAWGMPNWQVRYGGGGEDDPYNVVSPESGLIVVTGETRGFGAQESAILTAGFNTAGELLWQSMWDSPDADIKPSATTDFGGNTFIVADSIGLGSHWQPVLLKYDSQGNLLWEKTIQSTGSNTDSSIATGLGYLIVVTSYSLSNEYGISLFKFDYDGHLIDHTTTLTTGMPDDPSASVDISGSVYVSGTDFLNFDPFVLAFLAMRFDSDLQPVWAKSWVLGDFACFGMENNMLSQLLVVTDILVVGQITLAGYSQKTCVLRFDTSGNLEWAKSWSDPDLDSGLYCATSGIGGATIFGGLAANNQLNMVNVGGTLETVSTTPRAEAAAVANLSIGASSPGGSVSPLSGVVDSGGGLADMLLMGIDPDDI